MTQSELFEKYSEFIPEGWYGFDSLKPAWIPEINELLDEMKEIPGFEIHQIKEKFGGLRFYVKCEDEELKEKAFNLERKYNK